VHTGTTPQHWHCILYTAFTRPSPAADSNNGLRYKEPRFKASAGPKSGGLTAPSMEGLPSPHDTSQTEPFISKLLPSMVCHHNQWGSNAKVKFGSTLEGTIKNPPGPTPCVFAPQSYNNIANMQHESDGFIRSITSFQGKYGPTRLHLPQAYPRPHVARTSSPHSMIVLLSRTPVATCSGFLRNLLQRSFQHF
jgi:hypothetical protein